MIIIRKAQIRDALRIQKIIEPYAKEGKMLPRPIYEIYENIRDYFVVVVNGRIIGCCALHIFGKEYNPTKNKKEEILAEVRGLAVLKNWQGKKIGTKLIKKCIKEAKDLEITKVFALILKENLDFFNKSGFKKISKRNLPQKTWQECIRCPRFPTECNEVALILAIPN